MAVRIIDAVTAAGFLRGDRHRDATLRGDIPGFD